MLKQWQARFGKWWRRKLRRQIDSPLDIPGVTVWFTADDAYPDRFATLPAREGEKVRTIRNRVDGSLIKVHGVAEVRKTPSQE